MRAFGTDSSMISAQTLRVCREGKPVPTFPDHALGSSVTGRQRRQFRGIIGRGITAPDHMHVRTKQDQISLEDRARRFACNVQHAKRRRPAAKRLFQSRSFVSPVQAKQSVAYVRNSILDRRAVLQPNMRQPCSWPTGRPVLSEQVLGTARNIVDDRRIDIAITKFSANHLVHLALFDGRNPGKIVANPSTCRAVVTDFRTPLRAPFAVTERGVARSPDVPFSDLAPLDLI